MDVYQESLLYKYSKGYRILRGTAGSGKTVVLAGKAVQEKVMNKNKRILIITFTNSLVGEIKSSIEKVLEAEEIEDVTVSDFEVTTIDSLVQNLVFRYTDNIKKKTNSKKARRILFNYLERNPNLIPDDAKYDVILCDESQDFSKELFSVVRSLSKKNSLIIFGVDETQRIYDGTDWKWIDVGFDARGKVTILRKSYRNPGKIFQLAIEFLRQDLQLMKELKELDAVVLDKGIESIRKDDGEIEFYETNNEFEKVAEIVVDLIENGTNYGDIFILTSLECHVKLFYRAISSKAPHLKNKLHYFSYHSPKKYKFVPDDKIVIMPYKSAKGLERPVVIVTGIGNLPYDSSREVAEKRRDRRTLYVALTRAQKKLIITSSREKDNGFTGDMKSVIERLSLVR
ncbi:UvrD-helicase domain-containing protein [Desulfurobacterium pacificum]|uniref:UvrD-helicase domain-containing protein n=1 Tax=Desulfurobacterium pacificum TaxID=240166 RepID=UPI0024B77609|nr:UvrD-helicase domain-containing protein [Desulfurobacterium pacificum]